MAISSQQRSGDLAEMLKSERRLLKAQLYVALPGIIQSFNPVTVTCVVQPAIHAVRRNAKGEKISESLPLLVDVPVIFPRGGGCTLTFPIKAGDECLLVFADRCIDFWWQNGGVQEPIDPRQHDLSDAFALVGPQSQAQKIGNISTQATQLRTDDGATFIEVAAGHAITLKTSGKLTATADGGTEITSPTILLNGAVTINGSLTQGKGSAGGTATLLGPLRVDNDVTASGISVAAHRHGGVQNGSGTTGGPQ